MRVQFLTNAMQWKAGDIVDLPDTQANWLVNVGKATFEIVEPEPEPAPKPKRASRSRSKK